MGLNENRVAQLLERARREVEAGLLPSAQIAIGLDGEVVVSESFGTATPQTRYNIFSATKALIATVMWQLMAEGAVAPEDPVARHFPEFAGQGKGDITIEQVMIHQGGFPRAPIGPPHWADRSWRIDKMASWRLNWEPGTQFEYHPTSAHWVLGEIIERVDRRDYRESVRERVLVPLGLRSLALGVAPDEQGDVADMAPIGEAPTPDELEAAFGVRTYDLGEVTPEALTFFNDPAVRAIGVPGGGGMSNAADLASFYQALLHNRRPDGETFMDAAWLADGTGRIRGTLPDPILGHPSNRSLGLVIAGDDGLSSLRGMGKTVSPRTFGHNGAAGQIVWADPETGLSLCYLTNGIDRNFLREARRTVAIASLAGRLTEPD